ncbi:MAG: hypothetical protein HRT88_02640 [Lentisphaeraceae bacterium]|nr:hypothetical protein [Lentisphaeraceae bacterium]
MQDKCSLCSQKIEDDRGYYNTPSGMFCVLCYERHEVLKYEQLAQQAIHSSKDSSLFGEKIN